MRRIIPLFLIALSLVFRADAQERAVDNIRADDFFDCPIPVDNSGYINIYKMITALSGCAGLNPELLLEDPLRTEIVDFGIYTPIYDEAESGASGQLIGIRHSAWDREIQLEDGLIFGLRLHFKDVLAGANQEIEIHIIRPNADAENGSGVIDEVNYKPLTDNMIEMVLFQITSPEEMIPGIWTFEVHHNGRIVAIKHFKLVL